MVRFWIMTVDSITIYRTIGITGGLMLLSTILLHLLWTKSKEFRINGLKGEEAKPKSFF